VDRTICVDVGVLERFARSGSEENINETCEHGDVVVRPIVVCEE
jgi:hypothetical protein